MLQAWSTSPTGNGRFLVIPTFILNFGIADHWEVVIEGRNFLLVQPMSADRRNTLRETALSLKGVLRQGSLQENHSGPSVGLEVGFFSLASALTPESARALCCGGVQLLVL